MLACPHEFSAPTVCCLRVSHCLVPCERCRTHYKPIHTLAHASPINSTAAYNTPIPIFEFCQTQRLTDLSCALRARLVLLVREYQQTRIPQLLFTQHRCQLF